MAMIGRWPKGVDTGRIAPLRTTAEGAIWSNPFGARRNGAIAALRTWVDTPGIDPEPRLALAPLRLVLTLRISDSRH